MFKNSEIDIFNKKIKIKIACVFLEKEN